MDSPAKITFHGVKCMSDQSYSARIEAVERLANLFKLERMVHLGVTTISLIMLLLTAGFLIYKNQADPVVLGPLFGSSGLITYSANRLLRMWDQALQVLTKSQEKEGE